MGDLGIQWFVREDLFSDYNFLFRLYCSGGYYMFDEV